MVSIGLIGAGFMGRTHATSYERCGEVSRIYLLGLPEDRAGAEKLAIECPKIMVFDEDAERFFEREFDAVDICTPTPTHAVHIRRAIAKRKAIMCEKPLALDSQLCRELAQEARKAGLIFMVAQVIRFWPAYVYCRDILTNGTLGALRHLILERFITFPTWGKWFAQLNESGGALYDLHVHDIDYARFLLGEPLRVSGMGRKQNGQAYLDIQTTLEFAGGIHVHAFASCEYPPSSPFRMAFHALFEKGSLEYGITKSPMLMQYDGTGGREIEPDSGLNGYDLECAYFAHCVATGSEPIHSTAESAGRTICLLEKIEESADRNGRWIKTKHSN
jgi:UDP-N-acetylglucosamine 3-dehydrogenase